ncbi:hypothetical protein HCR15_00065 [Wolbachia pipientis]|nr:hypothetical protein [Wolbachia pipientis]MBA8755586.1 hypothetical protein [Wolbachia pipientis]
MIPYESSSFNSTVNDLSQPSGKFASIAFSKLRSSGGVLHGVAGIS